MVLVWNNPSNDLGHSIVPKMLAEFCVFIEKDYIKYEIDFFQLFFTDISLPTYT